MKKVRVTQNEKEFIEKLINMLIAEEGFSDVDIQDIAAGFKTKTVNQCKGIEGSLIKKGLIEPPNEDFEGIIYLSPALYHYHPNWDINVLWTPEDFEEIELIVEPK